MRWLYVDASGRSQVLSLTHGDVRELDAGHLPSPLGQHTALRPSPRPTSSALPGVHRVDFQPPGTGWAALSTTAASPSHRRFQSSHSMLSIMLVARAGPQLRYRALRADLSSSFILAALEDVITFRSVSAGDGNPPPHQRQTAAMARRSILTV